MTSPLLTLLTHIGLLERCGQALHRVHASWSRTAISNSYRDNYGNRCACYECQTKAKVVLQEVGLLPSRHHESHD